MSELRALGKGGLVGIELLKIPCSALQVMVWAPISTRLDFTREEGWILKMTLWRTCASREDSSVLKILHRFPLTSWGTYSIFREGIQSPEWCLCRAVIAIVWYMWKHWLLVTARLTVSTFLWDKKEFFLCCPVLQLLHLFFFFLELPKDWEMQWVLCRKPVCAKCCIKALWRGV